MNVGALVLAGAIVERALDPARTLALYLASVVAASAASLLAHDAVVAGASGSVRDGRRAALPRAAPRG